MTPNQLARLVVVRARLEQERKTFEQSRVKAAIARTQGSGRMGTYKGDKYFVDRLADSIDRMLYESGLSGVTRWQRKGMRGKISPGKRNAGGAKER